MPTSGHLEDYIDGLTEESTPDTSNDMLLIRDATGGSLKKIAPATIASGGSGIPAPGWAAAGETWTYASADDPTYTFTISGDVTTKYSPGMRVKLTQSTGGTKYGLITKVEEAAGTSTVTLYMGTDYNLENEAISSPYYSVVKAPFGFPLDPTKWTVEATDATVRTQATPAQNTWYNLNAAHTIPIPIGAWNVSYQAAPFSVDASSGSWLLQATLSTANNSESDADWTGVVYAAAVTQLMTSLFRAKVITLTAKTSYYLNVRTTVANLDSLRLGNDNSKLILRAVSAYL